MEKKMKLSSGLLYVHSSHQVGNSILLPFFFQCELPYLKLPFACIGHKLVLLMAALEST